MANRRSAPRADGFSWLNSDFSGSYGMILRGCFPVAAGDRGNPACLPTGAAEGAFGVFRMAPTRLFGKTQMPSERGQNCISHKQLILNREGGKRGLVPPGLGS